MSHHRSFPVLTFAVGLADPQTLVARGREAMTLFKLVGAGDCGITAYDFEGGPPFRLAAYVHGLRQMGLNIRTERESHPGGWHARYVLETKVHVVSIHYRFHGERG